MNIALQSIELYKQSAKEDNHLIFDCLPIVLKENFLETVKELREKLKPMQVSCWATPGEKTRVKLEPYYGLDPILNNTYAYKGITFPIPNDNTDINIKFTFNFNDTTEQLDIYNLIDLIKLNGRRLVNGEHEYRVSDIIYLWTYKASSFIYLGVEYKNS